MRKAQRHLLIKQVIEEFPIRTQEELLKQTWALWRYRHAGNDFSRYP